MTEQTKRIAVNFGGGFVPGLNAVITGTVLAAHELGWEVVGIRDGFDGLLAPERYADGGLLPFTPRIVENLSADGAAILGNATRTDPFRVRQVNAENQVEEVDRSGQLIAKIAAEKIDAVISVVGPRALSILFRLHRQTRNCRVTQNATAGSVHAGIPGWSEVKMQTHAHSLDVTAGPGHNRVNVRRDVIQRDDRLGVEVPVDTGPNVPLGSGPSTA